MIYPLKLSYTTAHMMWGGTRLIESWGKKSNKMPLAETYELTVRDDGHMSHIENGEFAGMTLREYIEKNGNATVSDSYDGGRFPLLIKFIDASDKLSVQVHPDDSYARTVENDSGKTEMWYIIDAEPGAKIIYGLKSGISRENFSKAVAENKLDSVMNYVEVKKGESYFVPSGMLHAIGKGILIAEIQQNSDLTYRVYDYDRLGADGKPRELHVKKALDVVRPFDINEIDAIRYSKGKSLTNCLASCEYFKVVKVTKPQKLYADKNSFNALTVLSEKATLNYNGNNYETRKGESWFIPANSGEYSLSGDSLEILVSSLK